MKTGTFGTVSHGTLRAEDLLPAFAGTLRELCDPNSEHDHLAKNALELLDRYNGAEEENADPATDQDLTEAVFDLDDALNEYAPPYGHFGTLEGDGSDFGFWLAQESLDDALHDGTLVKVGDPAELDALPADADEALCVNDHGNAALYVRKGDAWEMVWDIV